MQYTIIDGKLSTNDLLEFPLYDAQTGEPMQHEGLMQVDGALHDGILRIAYNAYTTVDYRVAPHATQESTDYVNGRAHAERQQRRREPKNVSTRYWQGWQDAWQQRATA